MDINVDGSRTLPSPGVYMPPMAPAIGPGPALSLPETVPTLQNRSFVVAPTDRQRTIQACDKCRERKTKCSGKYPCHRCNTRALICRYSSREPRLRGPAKARLRNVVSSMELRTPPSPAGHLQTPTEAEPDSSPQPFRHLNPHYDDPLEYAVVDELNTIPRSFHIDSEPYKVPNTATFETAHEASMQHFGYSPAISTFLPSPSPYSHPVHHAPQWRDMRRVQSHSSLIGSSERALDRNRQPRQWSAQGRVSPTSLAILNTYDQLMPSSAPVEPRMPYYHPQSIHPWSYHSDGGSTRSEPLSSGEPVLGYSPSSSEDVSEPSGHTSGIGATSNPDSHQYTHIQVFSGHQDFEPSANYCGPQYRQPQNFAHNDHLTREGLMASAMHAESNSNNMHLGFQLAYP